MNYQETVDFLYSQLPAFQRAGKQAIKPKLTNIRELCEYLGNPQNNFRSIHVAGTNGKGSSSHFITSILMEAGYKVGLYTSPHLKDYRERFKVNGNLIPENYVIQFIDGIKSKIENLRPSFFEVSVAMAFQYFSDEQVDIAVIEVGLGGRLDSTNIISNKVLSLITNIGYDHTDILGDTLDKIAFEKAGIIRENIPVVVSEYLPETRPVFEKVAQINNSEIVFAEDNYTVDHINETIESLYLEVINNESQEKYSLNSGLTGHYQISNIKGVIAAVEMLNNRKLLEIDHNSIDLGIKNVVTNTGLKGRWQILGRNPYIICDTGHNSQAFEITINRIKSENFSQIHFIMGFVKDKDLSQLQKLLPEGCLLYLCAIDSPRSYILDELKQIEFSMAKNISYFDNVNSALESVRLKAKKNDCIFIGGSTYLVAELDNI